jgi:hypothetical protein
MDPKKDDTKKTERTEDTKALQAKLDDAEKRLAEYEDRVQKMDAKVEELLGEKKAEQEKRRKAAQAAAEKDGDLEAYRKSVEEEREKERNEYKAQIAERDGWINQSVREAEALTLAASLAVDGSESLLLPQIRKRIGVEIRDGKPRAVILDDEGKPSAKTTEDLGKEIAARPENAPVIVASKAAGGGAKGSTRGGAAKGKKTSQMNAAEKSAYISEHGLTAWSELVSAEAAAN